MMDYHYYILNCLLGTKFAYIQSSSLVEPGLSHHSVVIGDKIYYIRESLGL